VEAHGSPGRIRVGLLGGTFDPPHLGHLILGDQSRVQLGLDSVLVLPAGRPPHKDAGAITPFPLRLEMVRRAFRGEPGFEVDPMEGDREGASYTVDTLKVLREVRKDASYWLLMGADSLEELGLWKEPEEILKLCRLGIYGRPGFDLGAAPRTWHDRIDAVSGPLLDVSSTEIRRLCARGGSLRHLVPVPVRDLIGAEGLYRSPR